MAARSKQHPAGSRACWAWIVAMAAWTAAIASPALAVDFLEDPFNAGSHAFFVFRGHNGLPQDTVHAIAVDRSGHLWVATQDGAAYYNGRRWTTVNMPDRERSNFVRAILPATDGSLWFATQADGVHVLRDGRWSRPAGLDARFSTVRVNALLETRDEDGPRIWIATHDDGIVLLARGTATTLDTSRGLPSNRIWALYEGGDPEHRAVWAGTELGLAAYVPETGNFARETGFPTASVNSFAETLDGAGARTLWVGTYGAGLATLHDGTWSQITSHDGLASDYVTSLCPSGRNARDESVWVGTDGGGIARIGPTGIETLDTRAGLPANGVYSVFETRAADGTDALWVGTRNGGLARLKEGQWRGFTPTINGAPLPINALLWHQPPQGPPAVLAATDGGGVFEISPGGIRRLDRVSARLTNEFAQALLETTDPGEGRALWVGTRNGGLTRLSDAGVTTFSRGNGAIPNDMVQCLLATYDDQGRLTVWVGTRGGLAAYRRGTWTRYGIADGLPDLSVLSLVEARGPAGTTDLWVGTADGLAVRSQDRFRVVPLDGVVANHSIQSLASLRRRDGGEELWLGTDGGGVAHRSLQRPDAPWTTLTDETVPALPNTVVYSILQDHAGRVYLLTNRGVARLAAGPGGGSSTAPTVFTFNREDGLPLNQGVRGAGLVDPAGRIWVGTVGGAAALDPTMAVLDRAAKTLNLYATVERNGARVLRSGDRLSFRDNHVLFQFELLSFFREPDTQYRTEMVGLDTAPTAWNPDVKKEFQTLPTGRYTFRVWGRDYAGNVSGPAELAFTVAPAPWRTWWALVGFLGLAVFATVVTARVRLAKLRQRETGLRALVAERTSELRTANAQLERLSYLDPLTEVANRRRFEDRLSEEWRRGIRSGQPLSLVMIDIDFFKAFNDRYGHQEGDRTLCAVAAALTAGLPRAGDTVARYGGEEFAVILAATDGAGAWQVAEHLRERVIALAIASEVSPISPVVTISCGVATTSPEQDTPASELIRAADDALYRAKAKGRNRTERAG